MGCGSSRVKIELEEVIEERNELARQLSNTSVALEFRVNELAAEIRRAEAELEAQQNEYKKILSQQDQRHEESRRKSMYKLEEQKEETDRARTDAEKMRRSVIRMEDVQDENKHLSRERNRLAYELEQAREELRLTLIIFKGKQEILELEKKRFENQSREMVHKEEIKFNEKAKQLNELLRAAEHKVKLAERDASIQREAALAVMRSGSFPHGTGGLDGTVTTAATISSTG